MKNTTNKHEMPEDSRRIVGIRETRVWSAGQMTSAASDTITNDILKHRKLYINHTFDCEDYGFETGDILEVTVASFWDFDESKVHVFKKVSDGNEIRPLIGFAYKNFGEISIQYQDFEPVRFKTKEVEYIGFVSAVIKPYSPPEIFDNSQKKKPVSTEILSVTCGNCKTTASGSADFLKAIAWKLGKNETLCNSCRW